MFWLKVKGKKNLYYILNMLILIKKKKLFIILYIIKWEYFKIFRYLYEFFLKC